MLVVESLSYYKNYILQFIIIHMIQFFYLNLQLKFGVQTIAY